MKYINATIAIVFLVVEVVSAQSRPVESIKTIVFVCEHGAGRSPIAAAYFNKMAKEKRLNYVAIFRGTDPDSVLGKAVKDGLAEEQYDISGWKPTHLMSEDIEQADIVITMDCILPSHYNTSTRLISWTNIPMSEGYSKAGAEIKKRVEKLIFQLSKNN